MAKLQAEANLSTKLTVGMTVRIVDPRSPYYEQTVVIEEVTKDDYIYVRHGNERLMLYPWKLEPISGPNEKGT